MTKNSNRFVTCATPSKELLTSASRSTCCRSRFIACRALCVAQTLFFSISNVHTVSHACPGPRERCPRPRSAPAHASWPTSPKRENKENCSPSDPCRLVLRPRLLHPTFSPAYTRTCRWFFAQFLARASNGHSTRIFSREEGQVQIQRCSGGWLAVAADALSNSKADCAC